jgi:TRAP-type uncharacterized transport system substrate-binding protein
MKLTLLFRRRWFWLYLPVILLAAFCLWMSANVWLPLPPRSFVMAGGLPNGNYTAMTLRYRDLLETRGIRVDTVTTENAAEPLQRLLNPASGVQVAIAQGLLAKPDMTSISALAAVERQPIWIFTRIPHITELQQLKGLRISTTAPGNPGWEVTQQLLHHAQLQDSDVQIETMPSPQAATALEEGKIDVVVMLASGEATIVRSLTRNPEIYLVNIERAASFVAREPRLKAFVLPQGAIEFRGNIPSRDLTMVGTHLNLLVSNQMHPALQRTLLDVAREIHELPSFLQRHAEFPDTRDVDFARSPLAQEWANGDRPWLEGLLPYWWAQLATLILYAILPILVITITILMWIPSLFNWKINAILQNFYGELKFLETDIEPTASERPIEIKKLLQRLDDIEAKVTLLDLPNSYANRWYTLREHLAHAREKLLNMRAR